MEAECTDVEALIARIDAGWAPRYLFFWGHSAKPGAALGKECLSQWYPVSFKVDGHTYPSAEHYMMRQKALLFGDALAAEQIASAREPAEAKALGRHVRDFDDDRWEEHRSRIVIEGNHAKFSQNPHLQQYLIASGTRVLVEASPRDTIWGIGLSGQNPRAHDPRTWRGLNLLGFGLMAVRARLRAEHGAE